MIKVINGFRDYSSVQPGVMLVNSQSLVNAAELKAAAFSSVNTPINPLLPFGASAYVLDFAKG
jgi:hypothetical protein